MVLSTSRLTSPLEGSITNAGFSSIVFYLVRREELEDRDRSAMQKYKKNLENKANFLKMEKEVESGALKLRDRCLDVEKFLWKGVTRKEESKTLEEVNVQEATPGQVETVMEEVRDMEVGEDSDVGMEVTMEEHVEEAVKKTLGDMEGVAEAAAPDLPYQTDLGLWSSGEALNVEEVKGRMGSIDQAHLTNGFILDCMELVRKKQMAPDDIVLAILRVFNIPASRDVKRHICDGLRYTEERMRRLGAKLEDRWVYMDRLSTSCQPLAILTSRLKGDLELGSVCLGCGDPARHYCRVCLLATYCDARCQTRHWEERHGQECSSWAATLHGDTGLIPPDQDIRPQLKVLQKAAKRAQGRAHRATVLYLEGLEDVEERKGEVEEGREALEALEVKLKDSQAEITRLGKLR